RIFQVNWFRKDDDGRFLWPGFGENARVLAWVMDRVAGRAGAVDAATGRLPLRDDLDLAGLDITADGWDQLFAVDPQAWRLEADQVADYFSVFGSRLPTELAE